MRRAPSSTGAGSTSCHPVQHPRPFGIDQSDQWRRFDQSQLQRAADTGDLDRRRRGGLRVSPAADAFLAFNRSSLGRPGFCCGGSSASRPSAPSGLLGNAVAVYGWDALAQLGWYSAAIYRSRAGCWWFIRCCSSASGNIAAFRARGRRSKACLRYARPWHLPLTERVAGNNLGITARIYGLRRPLGATTKMDGCSIYPAISAIFIGPVLQHRSRHSGLSADRLRLCHRLRTTASLTGATMSRR